MPVYIWKEKKTGREVEVIRHFSDYEIPPTEEESGLNPKKTKWERIIGTGIRTVRGSNWAGKGNW